MNRYPGFPEGVRLTPLPDPLFNRLLAEIDDFAELKLTLRACWLFSRQRGQPKRVAAADLLADPVLLAGVRPFSSNPRAALRAGLEQAVNRGTLLPAGGGQFMLNTPANRRALAARADPAASAATTSDNPAARAAAVLRRPGPAPGLEEMPAAEPPALPAGAIFALYEDNIGTIGPQLAQYLQEAEDRYPASWIADAFAIAVKENKRSWNYIAAILRRWGANGREEPNPQPTRTRQEQSHRHGKPEQHPETHYRPESGVRRRSR